MNTLLRFRTVLVSALLASFFCWFMPATPGFAAPTAKQNIVVHLSHFTDDLHRASMAMNIATALLKAGADVTVFVDLEGVRLVDKKLPKDLIWGVGEKKPTAQELYSAYIAAGGKIVVCPHCAHAAGIDKADLLTGAVLAKGPDEIAALMLAADKVIDY